jgi:membrane associated rhomboid family serine protease
MIVMFEYDGIAPETENPVIGPPAYSMVRFGAKESALIVYDGQYWRLLSCIMLHAGVIHIIPNVCIQLRIGGYLNLVFGTPSFFFIYFMTGFFGAIMR